MTRPKELHKGDRVMFRRDGTDDWSPREWEVRRIAIIYRDKFNHLIRSGSLTHWAARHELRKLPDRKAEEAIR